MQWEIFMDASLFLFFSGQCKNRASSQVQRHLSSWKPSLLGSLPNLRKGESLPIPVWWIAGQAANIVSVFGILEKVFRLLDLSEVLLVASLAIINGVMPIKITHPMNLLVCLPFCPLFCTWCLFVHLYVYFLLLKWAFVNIECHICKCSSILILPGVLNISVCLSICVSVGISFVCQWIYCPFKVEIGSKIWGNDTCPYCSMSTTSNQRQQRWRCSSKQVISGQYLQHSRAKLFQVSIYPVQFDKAANQRAPFSFPTISLAESIRVWKMKLSVVKTNKSRCPLLVCFSGILFSFLFPQQHCNLFKNLTSEDFKFVRESMIKCILATDMSKHNVILNSFKSKIPEFDYKNKEHVSEVGPSG